jgi:acyl dehydratase
MTTPTFHVGLALPPQERMATLETLVRYAGAAGDFYPMHYDLEAARRQGHDELSVHGLLKAAWLHQYLTQWAAGVAVVEDLDIKYRAMDFRDRPITLGGRVTAVDGDVTEVAVWTTADDGTQTTTGTARLRHASTRRTPPEAPTEETS